mgnify:CR=1 FL=1
MTLSFLEYTHRSIPCGVIAKREFQTASCSFRVSSRRQPVFVVLRGPICQHLEETCYVGGDFTRVFAGQRPPRPWLPDVECTIQHVGTGSLTSEGTTVGGRLAGRLPDRRRL